GKTERVAPAVWIHAWPGLDVASIGICGNVTNDTAWVGGRTGALACAAEWRDGAAYTLRPVHVDEGPIARVVTIEVGINAAPRRHPRTRFIGVSATEQPPA